MPKKRILLADDDPSIRKMTGARLQHAGYEVVVASDGEEVLAQVAAHDTIDVILLDLNMPKLNGFQVCQRLKANPQTAQIPIVIFTAAETFIKRLADLCIELGAADCIEKPFRSQALLEKIEEVVENERLVRQRKAGEKLRVLVVDDDRAIHDLLRHALPPTTFEVVAVGSGREALAAVKAAAFGVAFVDVVMPEMDGLATLQALLAEQPHLPVIMVTGYQVEDMVTLARQFGALDCLYKPFDEHASAIVQAIERFGNR